MSEIEQAHHADPIGLSSRIAKSSLGRISDEEKRCALEAIIAGLEADPGFKAAFLDNFGMDGVAACADECADELCMHCIGAQHRVHCRQNAGSPSLKASAASSPSPFFLFPILCSRASPSPSRPFRPSHQSLSRAHSCIVQYGKFRTVHVRCGEARTCGDVRERGVGGSGHARPRCY